MRRPDETDSTEEWCSEAGALLTGNDSDSMQETPAVSSRRRARGLAKSVAVAGLALAGAAAALMVRRGRRQTDLNSLIGAASVPEEPCAWDGENCVVSQCCRRTGMKCWEKTPNKSASCSMSCEDLGSDSDEEPWTCKMLGESRSGAYVEPLSASETPRQNPTLFCFVVVTKDGVVPPDVEVGYEQQLVEAMRKAKASIFACDASATFEGARTASADWRSINNTDVFARVWAEVKADGQYALHDWTVKVDADAVFFPGRLKQHLLDMRPRPDTAIYLHNVHFSLHFMGALEAISKQAVDIFLEDMDECLEHIGNDGGEDIFTMQCLDALEVGHMDDFSLLEDKYSHPGPMDLNDIDPCHTDAVVAIHPFKSVNSWMGCYKVAMGLIDKHDFTDCRNRWDGEACSLTSGLDHPNQDQPGTGIVAGPGAEVVED